MRIYFPLYAAAFQIHDIDQQADVAIKIEASVSKDGQFSAIATSTGISIVEGIKPDAIATSVYDDAYLSLGWGHLSVQFPSKSNSSIDERMYAAGLLEGLLTAARIRDFKHNADALLNASAKQHPGARSVIHDTFDAQVNAIRKNGNLVVGQSGPAPSDPWWAQARYALMQGKGLQDGFNLRAQELGAKNMTFIDLMILSSDGETPELLMAYDMQEYLMRQDVNDNDAFMQTGVKHKKHKRKPDYQRMSSQLQGLDDNKWREIMRKTGRCSALIRLSGDDLFMGHTTFSDFAEMHRIFKYYDFPIPNVKARKIGFSSYPGVSGSTDDFYLMDSGIAVTETTISMLSDEPYDKINDKDVRQKVPDYMRIMLSNRLAGSGKEWTDLMTKSETGTYSSQWMVVDYNLYEPGSDSVPKDTLWVLEQVPGMSHAEDMSATLNSQKYWGSYNRPWFTEVRDSMGATTAEELHGALFSRDKSPRANIFRKASGDVKSLVDMQNIMRRNNWPHEIDGGPQNTPDHAIAARGDLDKEHPYPFGAVDAKVTSSSLIKTLECNAISGPSATGDHKPFSWSPYPGVSHQGQPDVWDFPWIHMTENGATSLPRKAKSFLTHVVK